MFKHRMRFSSVALYLRYLLLLATWPTDIMLRKVSDNKVKVEIIGTLSEVGGQHCSPHSKTLVQTIPIQISILFWMIMTMETIQCLFYLTLFLCLIQCRLSIVYLWLVAVSCFEHIHKVIVNYVYFKNNNMTLFLSGCNSILNVHWPPLGQQCIFYMWFPYTHATAYCTYHRNRIAALFSAKSTDSLIWFYSFCTHDGLLCFGILISNWVYYVGRMFWYAATTSSLICGWQSGSLSVTISDDVFQGQFTNNCCHFVI